MDFRSLTDGFDTATPSGRLLFHILASVAEMERELIKERTIAALAAARAKGGGGGRQKSAMTPDKLDTARKLLAAGDKPAKIAKLLQVGLSTFTATAQPAPAFLIEDHLMGKGGSRGGRLSRGPASYAVDG